MGFRFSLKHANWLAHILQPAGATPSLDRFEANETLRHFLANFRSNFYSSRDLEARLRFLDRLDLDRYRGDPNVSNALERLREFFRYTRWFALLLPSGSHRRTDQLLTSEDFLRHIISIRTDDPGLVLQLDEPPQETVSLENVFPAFKVALNNITRWPGILLWTPEGDASFFELSTEIDILRERADWLFSHLAVQSGTPDLNLLRKQFHEALHLKNKESGLVKLLHLSDLHLGSAEARRRMPRVQTLLRSVIDELGEDDPIFPIITGDLMDTPKEENLGDVRAFFGFLNTL